MAAPRWLAADLPRPEAVDVHATARTLRVPPELAGTRLDVFLKLSLRHTSRTQAKRIAQHSAFSPDGKRLRPNNRVKPEQRVVLWRVPLDEADDSVEIPILYEDEHLLVVNKPAGITVHPTASHYHRTITRMLEERLPGRFLRLAHRLDRDTSGILLIAQSPQADRAFKMLLEGTLPIPRGVNSEIVKTYKAITWGRPPDGPITLPLERDEGNPLRVKIRCCEPGQGQMAHTDVRVDEDREGYALVQCRLLTGRQHQIRVHLSHLGTPVVGDRLYGPDERLHARGADGELTPEDWALLEMPRQALHAWRYELPHPLTWERLDLTAPLPIDMLDFWASKQPHPGRQAPGPKAGST